MKTEIPNAAAAAKSAATGGVAMTLDHLSVAFFGVPLAQWVACFSGALFGATWFPPGDKVSRPWAVVTNTLAGVFLTGLVMSQWQLAQGVSAGLGFFISSAPLLVMRSVRARLTPHIDKGANDV